MDPKPLHQISITTKGLKKNKSSIGSSPKSASEEERFDQILNEFRDIDKDMNKQLSFDEIHSFLTQKQSGEEFDFILCQELFARLDRDSDGVVTLEEFVGAYVEVEGLIVEQIKSLRADVRKYAKEVEENNLRLERARATEVMRGTGVMEGSIVTVEVKSAVNIMPTTADGLSNAFVILELAEMSANTKEAGKTLNPVWNEVFTFPVAEKGQELKLRILSKNTRNNTFVGKVSLALGLFADQLKREQYFSLQGEEDKQGKGKILLEVQWIWSKVRYYIDLIDQIKRFIEDDKQKIISLNSQLEKLRRPFGLITNKENRRESSLSVDAFGGLSQGHFSGKLLLNGNISAASRNPEVYKLQYGYLLVFIILSTISSFSRCDFLNCAIACCGYYYWMLNNKIGIQMFVFMVFVSEVVDAIGVLVFIKAFKEHGLFDDLLVGLRVFLIGFKAMLGIEFSKNLGS